MKDTIEQLKFSLDKSLPLSDEDVHHTEIEKFPENGKTMRITYTIFLK